jgi:hypothetical protein
MFPFTRGPMGVALQKMAAFLTHFCLLEGRPVLIAGSQNPGRNRSLSSFFCFLLPRKILQHVVECCLVFIVASVADFKAPAFALGAASASPVF